MAMAAATICLSMIVKNEAHVIERCLASAKPLVTRWCIVDTGSSDDTMTRILAFLSGVAGTLHERPWKNFAHNRNEAFDLARAEGCDYILYIDADETFVAPDGFAWPQLSADAYELTCHYDATRYARAALVASKKPWRWRGVLHEYLECSEPHQTGSLAAPTVLIRHDGARSRDPTTYLKDIAVLEAALRDDGDDSRNVFYLAQSYRDAGRWTEACSTYLRRTTMGGWDEEVWYAWLQIAVLTERLGKAPEQVSAAYLRAFQQRPARAEPLVELARFHRLRGEHALAYVYAKHASEIACPPDRLFIDQATYDWRALDELAISAFYVGTDAARAAGARAAQMLMSLTTVPAAERGRIANNARYYGT